MKATLRVTKALADTQRVRILLLLERGELCVCQIIEVLGLAPSTVSKHLSLLHAAGLVDVRKEGRWVYYSLSAESGRQVALLLQWRDMHAAARVVYQHIDVVTAGGEDAIPVRRFADIAGDGLHADLGGALR